MLKQLVGDSQPDFVTTYTRNPNVLRMIAKISHEIYPIINDDALRNIALQMDHASLHDVTYHIQRYGADGLFGDGDPADRPFTTDGIPLKQQFIELTNIRNALVVAARVRRNS